MFAKDQAPFTLTAALLMSLQPVLVTLSKNPLGGFSYSVPSSTMLSEALKLAISFTLLSQQLLSGKITRCCTIYSLTEFCCTSSRRSSTLSTTASSSSCRRSTRRPSSSSRR